jgi:hypothetical protein
MFEYRLDRHIRHGLGWGIPLARRVDNELLPAGHNVVRDLRSSTATYDGPKSTANGQLSQGMPTYPGQTKITDRSLSQVFHALKGAGAPDQKTPDRFKVRSGNVEDLCPFRSDGPATMTREDQTTASVYCIPAAPEKHRRDKMLLLFSRARRGLRPRTRRNSGSRGALVKSSCPRSGASREQGSKR